MNIHALIDYSFLYYKYKFQLDSGKITRLTHKMLVNNEMVDKDISQIYYSIKEIEKFRKDIENAGHSCIVSVCFDMPSSRKIVDETATTGESTAANQYKSNRVKKLNEEDFENIQLVEKILSDAGYNTYRFAGYEADDIIAHMVKMYKDSFDYTVIYTPDADLLVNIQDKVMAQRYKVMKGYQTVNMSNFEEYLSAEFKCYIPFNSLMLFKATCGDKSDMIDGIKGFGPKAFDKLVCYLSEQGVNWYQCSTYESTFKLLEMCQGYLTDEQMKQAIESLSLVRPLIFEDGLVQHPVKISTPKLREDSYMRLNMKSLTL